MQFDDWGNKFDISAGEEAPEQRYRKLAVETWDAPTTSHRLVRSMTDDASNLV